MTYIPLLTGAAAKNLIKDFDHSQIQPYSQYERENTNKKIKEILNKRIKKYDNFMFYFFYCTTALLSYYNDIKNTIYKSNIIIIVREIYRKIFILFFILYVLS